VAQIFTARKPFWNGKFAWQVTDLALDFRGVKQRIQPQNRCDPRIGSKKAGRSRNDRHFACPVRSKKSMDATPRNLQIKCKVSALGAKVTRELGGLNHVLCTWHKPCYRGMECKESVQEGEPDGRCALIVLRINRISCPQIPKQRN
jgi:hypothetical protein